MLFFIYEWTSLDWKLQEGRDHILVYVGHESFMVPSGKKYLEPTNYLDKWVNEWMDEWAN